MSLQSRLTDLVVAIGADIKQLRADVTALGAGGGGSSGVVVMDSGVVTSPVGATDTVDAGSATLSSPLGIIDGGTDIMVSPTLFVDGGTDPDEPYVGMIVPEYADTQSLTTLFENGLV